MLRNLASCRRYSSQALAKTPLYEFHLKHQGKMVDYAGFHMPVLYKAQSHIESHNWVRQKSGLFDVSHMLQHRFSGPGTTEMLESVTPADLRSLEPFTSTLSVLLTKTGGIVDDTIITKHDQDEYYVVTNAGRRAEDVAFFEDAIAHSSSGSPKRETIEGGLIALQGPETKNLLQQMTQFDLNSLKFGHSAYIKFAGLGEYHVGRGGYTGEDGFEVSIPDHAESAQFAEAFLDAGKGVAMPIGLAARDSLRLEAGMCLYGYEMTESISPVTASLAWVIGKRRREAGDAPFNGKDAILSELAAKPQQRRVGLFCEGPAAREGSLLFKVGDDGKDDSTAVGRITSGSFSPTLGKNIAMGYLDRALTKTGTELQVKVRNKLRPAQVTKMPFVEPNYFR